MLWLQYDDQSKIVAHTNFMSLTVKQTGVLKGSIAGMAITIAVILYGIWQNPFNFDSALFDSERLGVAIKSALLPALYLVLSIGQVARHRFFHAEDIDGSGLTAGSEQAKILQSLLQNTLEQFLIALVVYLAWAFVMPSHWLSVVPLAATLFVIGRMLFFRNYALGAPARSLGFALTFYPTIVMLIAMIAHIIWNRFLL